MGLNSALLFTLYDHVLTIDGKDFIIRLEFLTEYYRTYCFSFNFNGLKYFAHFTKDLFTLNGQSYFRHADYEAYMECSTLLGEQVRSFPNLPIYRRSKYRMNPVWILCIDNTDVYVELSFGDNYNYYPKFDLLSPYCHKGVFDGSTYYFTRPTTLFTARIDLESRIALHEKTHPDLLKSVLDNICSDASSCPYDVLGGILTQDLRIFYEESILGCLGKPCKMQDKSRKIATEKKLVSPEAVRVLGQGCFERLSKECTHFRPDKSQLGKDSRKSTRAKTKNYKLNKKKKYKKTCVALVETKKLKSKVAGKMTRIKENGIKVKNK